MDRDNESTAWQRHPLSSALAVLLLIPTSWVTFRAVWEWISYLRTGEPFNGGEPWASDFGATMFALLIPGAGLVVAGIVRLFRADRECVLLASEVAVFFSSCFVYLIFWPGVIYF